MIGIAAVGSVVAVVLRKLKMNVGIFFTPRQLAGFSTLSVVSAKYLIAVSRLIPAV